MASDPTIPERLAALGFVPGPGCWLTIDTLDHEGVVVARVDKPDGQCLAVIDAQSSMPSTQPVARWLPCDPSHTPENRNAAIDFLAHRLAGKRVPLPCAWRWPDIAMAMAEKVDNYDYVGFSLSAMEARGPARLSVVAAALLATGDPNHARAALHLVGFEQAVAWAEQLSATRGASTAGTESETP